MKFSIFKFSFFFNFYNISTKKSSVSYKISKASFKILKKITRLYPNNAEITAEQFLCATEYSNQQKLTIYKSITADVDLFSILKNL